VLDPPEVCAAAEDAFGEQESGGERKVVPWGTHRHGQTVGPLVVSVGFHDADLQRLLGGDDVLRIFGVPPTHPADADLDGGRRVPQRPSPRRICTYAL